MSFEPVMEALNVSKVYLLYNKPEDRLKQMLVPKFKRLFAPVIGKLFPRLRADAPRFREFWALRDVSVALKPHETLGIIGQNGSGKSTLLQIICGTLTPSTGVARSQGRVAALLELGAGFNPDFTGRENVYLNAAIYGLTKAEIDDRLQAIVDFAEIGEHLDQPVKTYSSGMFVRLAFSVIANIDADVLVIDEALAVGDAYFQQKCMRFLRKFQEHGSIFFVSHDTGAMMSFCDRVIWLDQGSIRSQGNPREVCEEYLAYLYQKNTGSSDNKEKTDLSDPELSINVISDDTTNAQIEKKIFDERSFGDRSAEIISCSLRDMQGEILHSVRGGEAAKIEVTFRANTNVSSVISGFIVKDRLGQYIFGDNTAQISAQNSLDLYPADLGRAIFEFTMPELAPGTYLVVLSVASGTLANHVQHHWVHEAIAFDSHSSIDTGVTMRIPVKSSLSALK